MGKLDLGEIEYRTNPISVALSKEEKVSAATVAVMGIFEGILQ